jgi:hypothetical protein
MAANLPVQPLNPNTLQGTKYLVLFRRFPNMQFWAQNHFVPGITLGEAVQMNPFVDIRRAGDKVTIDPVTITFILDADLWAWSELFDWIAAIGKMKNTTDRNKLIRNTTPVSLDNSIYSDFSLQILSPSNNPVMQYNYKNAWPSSLSTFTMTTTDSAETVLTCDCTFYFDYFEIERLKGIPAVQNAASDH